MLLICISLLTRNIGELQCSYLHFCLSALIGIKQQPESGSHVFPDSCVCPLAHSRLLPEVVAGDQGLVGVLVIQAAEAVSGVTVMGPAVQVAVPVDLDAHDPSLEGQSARRVSTCVGYSLCEHQTLLLSNVIVRKDFLLWGKILIKRFQCHKHGLGYHGGGRHASPFFPSGTH